MRLASTSSLASPPPLPPPPPGVNVSSPSGGSPPPGPSGGETEEKDSVPLPLLIAKCNGCNTGGGRRKAGRLLLPSSPCFDEEDGAREEEVVVVVGFVVKVLFILVFRGLARPPVPRIGVMGVGFHTTDAEPDPVDDALDVIDGRRAHSAAAMEEVGRGASGVELGTSTGSLLPPRVGLGG